MSLPLPWPRIKQDGSDPLAMVPYICANMPCVDLLPAERASLLRKSGESSGLGPEQVQILQQLLEDPGEPTSQYTLLPFQLDTRQGVKEIKALMSPAHPGNFITIVSTLCYALSRGSVHSPEPLTDLEQAKKVTKELLLSTLHLAGTCAMMPREDGGVFDPHLRVYGTTNVRGVDASIFPLVPRGNIQATVFAVAEKAADLIKEDLWSRPEGI